MVEYENVLSQIKELLKDHPQGLNIRSISKEININRMSVAKYMEVLTARGTVDFRVLGNSKIFFLAQQVPPSTLFKFSSNLIVVLNQHLRIIQVNDAFLRYTNASKQQIINSKMDETGIDITSNPAILEAVSDLLRGNEKHIELDIRNEDNSFFYSVNLIPIVFEDLTPGIILIYEDITKRKKAEIALKKSKEKYETLFNCVNDAIVITDLDGRFLEVNDTFIERFGYSREDLILSQFKPEYFDFNECYNKLKNNSKELYEKGYFSFNTVVTTKLGKKLPHEVGCRIIDFMGEKAILCIGRDILEHDKDDESFMESEILFRTIFENTRNPMALVSEDSSVILVNSCFENICGKPREDIIGRSFTEFVHKNDIEQMIKYHQIRRVDENLAPNNYGFRLVDKAGEVHECLMNINMIPGTTKSIASLTDVTEYADAIEILKRNEKAYIEFLDNLNVSVFETGVYGNITYLNKIAMINTGYDKEDIKKGLHFKQLLAPENHDIAVKRRKDCIEGGNVIDQKLTALRKDGTEYPIILCSSPVYKKNKVSGTRGYFFEDSN